MTETSSGDDADNTSQIKNLINHIRSTNDEEKKLTIMRIPELILQSFESTNHILNQLLLITYNLSTDSELYEKLTIGNRNNINRHLLRLYTETIKDHQPDQIDALVKLIDHSDSSQMLIELANALNNCGNSNNRNIIDDAFMTIKNRAAENCYVDALLMILSFSPAP